MPCSFSVFADEVARVEAELAQPAGRLGLDQDVRTRQQALEALALRGEIEADAALVEVAVREVEALARVEGRNSARAGAFGRLDPNDVRAEVRQQASAELALLVRQIDDLESLQGVTVTHLCLQNLVSPEG